MITIILFAAAVAMWGCIIGALFMFSINIITKALGVKEYFLLFLCLFSIMFIGIMGIIAIPNFIMNY